MASPSPEKMEVDRSRLLAAGTPRLPAPLSMSLTSPLTTPLKSPPTGEYADKLVRKLHTSY